MESVGAVLFLLLAVVLSDSILRLIPWPLPLPLVQIALGAAIGSVTDLGVVLNPELFFLLFLPPLLFLDGWRIPKEGLFKDHVMILELSLGLVIFTVLGMGFFIHWMIPSMPLGVAFALAAVVSPTDPIAVSAIASRVPIPKRLMHILEGESLLNDASGLVCLRFAIAAVLTGTFSAANAFKTFLWLAAEGILMGVGVTMIVTTIKAFIARRFGEDAGSQALLSLLLPFGAYLAAEHFGGSGILAAVAAGITMSYVETTGQSLAATRVRRTAVWDTVQFAANGVIFVLLGEQFPDLMDRAVDIVEEANHNETWWLAVYVIAINFGLASLRFVWVWTSLKLTWFRATRRGEAPPKQNWRLTAAASLAGVRGAITLAGVLTLPLTLADGTAFPARDLAIFLAAGVIILSLTGASIGLPRLLKDLKLPPEHSHTVAEERARITASKAAIRAIESAQHEMAQNRSDANLYAEVGARLMEIYHRRIDGGLLNEETREQAQYINQIERTLRLAALKAERDQFFHLARTRQIEDDLMRKLVREIDLMEAQHGT